MSASLSGRSAIWSAGSAMPTATTRRGCGGGFDGVRSGTHEMEFEADQVFTANPWAEQWIFHSPAPFVMRFCRTALRNSTSCVPNSGWTTFHVRDEGDLDHALSLMRLSYLRYALKTA